MRITGFSAILTALAGAMLLALLALPLHASTSEKPEERADAGPVLVPAAPPRTLAIPDAELADLPPAEQPPGDFTAAQYIDSAGCVFVRTPAGWRARVARDGSAICGYPPTFTARRVAPDLVSPLFPEPEEPRAQRIERVLTETILPNLQDGELVAQADVPAAPQVVTSEPQVAAAQTAAAVPAVTPPAAASPPTAATVAASDPLGFAAAVEHGPKVAAMPVSRTDRMCELMGAETSARPGVGGSSALGFCGATLASAVAKVETTAVADAAAPGPTAEPARQIQTTPPRQLAAAATVDGAATPSAVGHPALPGKGARPAAKGAAKSADSTSRHGGQGQAKARSEPKSTTGPMMIPAGARFVQIGSYRDSANAERTAKLLIGMGLPVVRSAGGGKQSIMIGPLDGREAIVRTIDKMRRAGFRDAYARR